MANSSAEKEITSSKKEKKSNPLPHVVKSLKSCLDHFFFKLHPLALSFSYSASDWLTLAFLPNSYHSCTSCPKPNRSAETRQQKTEPLIENRWTLRCTFSSRKQFKKHLIWSETVAIVKKRHYEMMHKANSNEFNKGRLLKAPGSPMSSYSAVKNPPSVSLNERKCGRERKTVQSLRCVKIADHKAGWAC